MRHHALTLFFLAMLTGCKPLSTDAELIEPEIGSGGFNQVVEFTVDGKKNFIKHSSGKPIASYNQGKFYFTIEDDTDEMTFHFSGHIAKLQAGSYQIYNCTGTEDCSEEKLAKNETVLFDSSNVDEPVKSAYNLPALGLKPLNLEITSVSDGAEDTYNKTKIIKGHFDVEVASVMPGPATVGKSTKISANFEVECLTKE
jgi:hypothetical protein